MTLQELESWAPRYIAESLAVSNAHPVRLLLDACCLPSVAECCGQHGVRATVLRAVVQVTLLVAFYDFFLT